MGIYNLFSFIYPCIPQALLAVLPPINSLKFFLSNLYPANNAKFNNIHLKYTCMGICSPNIQFIPTKSSLSGHRAYKCIKYTLHAGNKCRSINSYGYIKAIPIKQQQVFVLAFFTDSCIIIVMLIY